MYIFNKRKSYEMKNNIFYYWKILLEFGKLLYKREEFKGANETLKDSLEIFDQLLDSQKDRFLLITSLHYLSMSLEKSLYVNVHLIEYIKQSESEEVLQTCLQQIKQSQDLSTLKYQPAIEYIADKLVNKTNQKNEIKTGIYGNFISV